MKSFLAMWLAASLFMLAWVTTSYATQPHTPITVELDISHAPALNEQATATITVSSTQDAPGTTVELVLPPDSTASVSNWTINLVANRPITLTSRFSIRKLGNATVSARARKMFAPDNAWGDMKSIPLTIRNQALAPTQGGGASQRGWTVDTLPRAARIAPGNAPVVSTQPLPFAWPRAAVPQAKSNLPRTTPNLRLPARPLAAPAPGTVTLTGGWFYTDRNGNQQAIDQQLVEVLKSDGTSMSPSPVYCFTDSTGAYSCNFDPGSNGNSFAVAVRSWTNFGDRLGVFASVDGSGCADAIGCSYPVTAPTVSCSSGQTCAVGSFVVGTGVGDPWLGAMWMTQDLIRVWKRLFNDVGVSAGPGRIGFPAPSGHGTHAHVPPADGWIAVEPPAHTSAHPPTHEYGHVVMANKWASFAIKFPTFDCGSSHDIPDATGPGCALIEGWPDFWSAYGTGDPAYLYTAGGAISNFETRSGYRAWASGDQVEGNVAAVMWDMYDSASDGPSNGLKDRLSDGIAKVWATLNSAGTNNFAGWWQLYQNKGYPPCPALEIIQYDTINYSLAGCQTYTISTSGSGGSTSGGGTYMNGTSITVTATPNSGNTFLNWTEGSTVVSTSSSYTFTVSSSRSLVANFGAPAAMTSPTAGSTLPGASVTFSWSAGGGVTDYFLAIGSSVGDHTYYYADQGTSRSVTATGLPTDGSTVYVRLYSQINGVYQWNDYTYTAASPAVMTSPAQGSTLSGSSVTFSWSAGGGVTDYFLSINDASDFSGHSWWYEDEGTNRSVTVTGLPTDGRTLYARLYSKIGGVYQWKDYSYTAHTATYSIGVSAAPPAGGSVSGGGTYAGGSSRTVTATPNSGYTFVNWTENGSVASSSASYTFTLTGNRALVANFVQTFTIAVSASPPSGGSVGGGGTYNSGTSRTVTATANTGYTFVNWTENGSVASSSASYNFTLTGNRTLVANFVQTFTIALSASPVAGGSVSGGGTYNSGTSQSVTATANAGYTFANWTEGGNVVSSAATYPFTLNANRTLVAHFSKTFTIAVSASPAAGGTVGGGGTFVAGTSRTVTATAKSGYIFKNWTEGTSAVSSAASYTFTLNANRTLVAHFAKVFVHDFNGDRKSDILMRNGNSGGLSLWLMNGNQVMQKTPNAGMATHWDIVAQRDFNADGKADILWRDKTTGAVVLWLMNGAQVTQSVKVTTLPSNWALEGASDFNGDGKADLLWRNTTNGSLSVWLMNGGAVSQHAVVGNMPARWTVAATGSKGEIFWRDGPTGAVQQWVMNGFTVAHRYSIGALPAGWKIVGSGDFDGTGSADLLWRNTNNGAAAIWYLTNGVKTKSDSLPTRPLAWSIDLTGDFDGNGKTDIVWTNTENGARLIWFMNGSTVDSTANLAVLPTVWAIQSLNAE